MLQMAQRCFPKSGTSSTFLQLLTCSATYGHPLPAEQFANCPVQLIKVHPLLAPEAQELVTFCLGSPASPVLLEAVMAKAAGFVECIVAVCALIKGWASELTEDAGTVTLAAPELQALQVLHCAVCCAVHLRPSKDIVECAVLYRVPCAVLYRVPCAVPCRTPCRVPCHAVLWCAVLC